MRIVLLPILVIAAGFVWLTSGALPPVVASHFGPGGVANGFMGKGTYMAFMLALVIVVPALLGLLGQVVRVVPVQLINLPNKQYWLAPQRRAATLQSLSSIGVPFAVAVAAFLCFVHWLVIQANTVEPAKLSESALFVGVAIFGVVTVLWLVTLFRRFWRVP